ncbi:MAG: hypothetical protein KGJ44_07575 [Betaproteobacteria bacterium]|nr:hypothetical protein [Betaproteobacteria bacterium]
MGHDVFDRLELSRLTDRISIFDWFAIKLLMVTDSTSVTYGPAPGNALPFSLGEVVRALTHPPGGGPWIKVTKAHRRLDPNGTGSGPSRVTPANLENFTFSAASLAGYDQVWLVGAEHAWEGAELSEAELQALTHFMNAGGGVFATGDHEDMGVTLSGKVPRVRSMRKWWYSTTPPHGEPHAPDATGADRYDTLRPDVNGQFYFDNQSDDTPMPIWPTWYTWGIWEYPHPLLCGHHGVIDILPDHMHEGEVITPDGTDAASGWSGSGVPGGLGNSLSFNGETFTEYPTKDGVQARPMIVAQADVIAGHRTPSTESSHPSDSAPTNGRRFAVVGAYDGFASGVGRVAVDSTWHHFFDINIVGDPVAPPPKNQGFRASPAGQAALARIENYYVNIATWLTPNKGYFFVGWLMVAMRSAFAVELLPAPGREVSRTRQLQIGEAVYGGLRRFLPPCAVLDIVVVIYREIQIKWQLPNPPDPWGPQEREATIDPTQWTIAALGGMAIALHDALHDERKLTGHEARALLHKGLARGLHTFAHGKLHEAKATLHSADQLLRALERHGL